MRLQETFNADKLNYIIHNFNKYEKKLRPKESYKLYPPLEIAKRYLERSRYGKVRVEYRQKEGRGRQRAIRSMSLQTLPREIRQTIAEEFYIDIDMVNAVPVILLHLCSLNQLETPHLKTYILEREKKLSELKMKREQAKMTYIKVMNGGGLPRGATDHLHDFKDEMEKIYDFFIKKYPTEYKKHTEQREAENKNYNFKGSFISSFLYDIENNILMDMYKYFGSPTNAVLCFDGLMLLKGDYDIKGCEKMIRKKYKGLEFHLKIKPMNEGLDVGTLPYVYKPLDYISDYKNLLGNITYPEWIEEWTNNCCNHIFNGCKDFFITRETHKQPNKSEIIIDYKIVKRDDLLKTLKIKINLYVGESGHIEAYLGGGTNKQVGFIKDMLENGKIKTYKRVDFYPYLKKKGEPEIEFLNLFSGFYLEDLPKSDVVFEKTNIYNHLKNVICGGDEGEFNHFLDCFSDMIQDPANNKPSAHIFSGKQGGGKTAVGIFSQNVIGSPYVRIISNIAREFGNFNSGSTYKILKIFEEIPEKGVVHKQSERIKSMIGSHTEDIEPKGVDKWTITNCARLWFFTNNENGAYIEGDDRRYTMHKCINPRANDRTYFDPLFKEIHDEKVLKSAFDFFATRKYDIAVVSKPYTTKYKMDQKMDNLPLGIKFMKWYIEENYNYTEFENTLHEPQQDIIRRYKTWCEDNGHKFNSSSMKKQIKCKLDMEAKRIQYEGYRCLMYVFTIKEIQGKFRELIKDEAFKFDLA
jgi:hypothetical protein